MEDEEYRRNYEELRALMQNIAIRLDRLAELVQGLHPPVQTPTRRTVIAVRDLTHGGHTRIVQSFLREMTLKTLSPQDRISRTDLYNAFIPYVYHWLRREVTYNGMTEEQATVLFETRLSQTSFTRTVSDMIRSGEMGGVESLQTSKGRMYAGLRFRTLMGEMLEKGQTFELPTKSLAQEGDTSA